MILHFHYLLPWVRNENCGISSGKYAHISEVHLDIQRVLWPLEASSSSSGMYNECRVRRLSPSPGFYQLPTVYLRKSLLWAWIFLFLESGDDSRWCGYCSSNPSLQRGPGRRNWGRGSLWVGLLALHSWIWAISDYWSSVWLLLEVRRAQCYLAGPLSPLCGGRE